MKTAHVVQAPSGEDGAIAVRNVSKRFKLYHNRRTGPVKELLCFWKREQYYREFVAVQDVSLTIERGEVVGVIGPNGAGKTTLLKMIAGLLPVDQGTITVRGKVTALMALGVGIHPDFTGRENIYYSGLLLGMSKKEIEEQTPAIIEFAELSDFIDQPFSTYSSGMRSRLLFSISMSVVPDILIVDETLATGDAHFVNKCFGRIRELCDSGKTILFVSHNPSHIERLCRRAIFMVGGRIHAEGAPAKVITAYNQWVFEKEKTAPLMLENQNFRMISGSGEVQVTDVKLKDAQGQEATGFYSGEKMEIEIEYRSDVPGNRSADLFVGFVLTKDCSYVSEVNTVNYVERPGGTIKDSQIELGRKGIIKLVFDPLLLLNNSYGLWIIIYTRQQQYYCEYKNVKPFFVARRRNVWLRADATFWHPCKITCESK